MTDGATPSHEAIARMLPDYVLGALPEDELGRVAAHLDGCARCRAELEGLLELTSLFADVGPPRPEVRRALTARLAPSRAWPTPAVTSPAPDTSSSVLPAPISLASERRPRTSSGPRWRGRAPAAALAVAAALVLALAGWIVLLQRELNQRELNEPDRIAALVTEPGNAHPLTDTALDTGATGVIYTDEDSRTALLLASGLPPLPAGKGYQVWFFTEAGEQVAAGFFPIDASGTGQALVRAPRPLGEFWAVGLSAEPVEGSPAPTGPLALGGWIR